MAERRWRVGGIVAAVGVTILVACSQDGTNPLASDSQAGVWNGHNSDGAALGGRVAVFRGFPDSTQIPLAGVTVDLELISTGDTAPSGGPPPDTSCAITTLCQGIRITVADTVIGPPPPPPPPPPVDSIPPDSNPPPTGACSVPGQFVGSTTTDQKGRFSFRGLQAGRYNVIAKPAQPNAFVNNLCGYLLATKQKVDDITIAVTPLQ